MKRERLEIIDLVLRIFASLVTIVGISVIVWQAVVATKALEVQSIAVEAQVWQDIGQEMSSITKIFIDHPELFSYFEQNKEIKPNDKLYPKVAAVADLYLDYIDKFDDDFIRSLDGMQKDGKYWIAWDNYFHDQFKKSSALCNRYKEVKSWYPEDGILAKLVAECCTQNGKELKSPN